MKRILSVSLIVLLSISSVYAASGKMGYVLTTDNISNFPKENFNGVDQKPEYNAANWFKSTYISVEEPQGAFISLNDLTKAISVSDYPAIWINVDRVGLANLEAAGFTQVMYDNIKAYVKNGGNLFLTKQACVIAYKIGRMGYAPGWSNGNYSTGGDIWTINAQLGLWPEIPQKFDRRSHDIYKYMTADGSINAYTYNEKVTYYETFPMIGEVSRTDNNNMWVDMYRKDKKTGGQAPEEDGYTHYDNGNPLRLTDFEGDWNCKVLGVWGQVVDFCAPGLIEFLPTGDWKGKIITNGFAAYQWGASNNFISNVQSLSAGVIEYVSGKVAPQPKPVEEGTRILINMELVNNKIKEIVSDKYVTLNCNKKPLNVPGAKGKALRMDGYSTYIVCPMAKDYNKKAVTVSVWCAPQTYPMMAIDQTATGWTSIAGNLNDGSHSGFAFRLSAQGEYEFICYAGGWKSVATATSKLPVNQWNHLVVTIDVENKNLKFYNNGSLVAASKLSGDINLGTDPIIIGKDAENPYFDRFLINTFNGLIDEFRLDDGVWSSSDISKDVKPENVANFNYPLSYWSGDPYRPRFHGMPTNNWTNECHGLTYSNGKYHVFFQKNGTGPYMSKLHWGHISSSNLLDWNEEYVAIYPLNSYDSKGCWSGAVFTDPSFSGTQNPTIVYTGVDNGRATMNFATPNDINLIGWTKMPDNPRVNGVPGGYDADFRDPYYFKKGDNKFLIVGCGKGGRGTTVLYKYEGGNWNHKGECFTSPNNQNGSFFEMPNLTDMGNGNWLFTATPLGTPVGVKTVYWIGTVGDNGVFTPKNQASGTIELSGMAREGFGLLSPSIYREGDRTIMMGIVPDKLPSGDNFELGWAHTYSLPREISINSAGELIQKPIREVEQYRSKENKYSKTSFELNGTQNLSPVSGRQLEVQCAATVGSNEFGFYLLKDQFGSLKIYFRPNTNEIVVDMTSVNRKSNDGGIFNGMYVSSLPSLVRAGETLKLDVFLDHSIIDVFINDKWATSVRCFSKDLNASGVELFSKGNTKFQYVNAWTLGDDFPTSGFSPRDEKSQEQPFFYSDGAIHYSFDEASDLYIYNESGIQCNAYENLMGNGQVPFTRKGFFIGIANNKSYKILAE